MKKESEIDLIHNQNKLKLNFNLCISFTCIQSYNVPIPICIVRESVHTIYRKRIHKVQLPNQNNLPTICFPMFWIIIYILGIHLGLMYLRTLSVYFRLNFPFLCLPLVYLYIKTSIIVYIVHYDLYVNLMSMCYCFYF